MLIVKILFLQIKNNKLSYEASLKQVDLMYPPEMKDAVKKSIENCKDVCEYGNDDFSFTKLGSHDVI